MPKIAKSVPWFLVDVHKDGYTFNKYNNTVLKIIILIYRCCFLRKSTGMQRNNGDLESKVISLMTFKNLRQSE